MLAIGLMSGTSIDGVDAALIETDGVHQIDRLAFHSMPYEPEFADRIRAILGRTEADGETHSGGAGIDLAARQSRRAALGEC